jgi:hypothetical protein
MSLISQSQFFGFYWITGPKVRLQHELVLKSANSGLGLTPVQQRQVLGNPEVSGSNPLPATKQTPTGVCSFIPTPIVGAWSTPRYFSPTIALKALVFR